MTDIYGMALGANTGSFWGKRTVAQNSNRCSGQVPNELLSALRGLRTIIVRRPGLVALLGINNDGFDYITGGRKFGNELWVALFESFLIQ